MRKIESYLIYTSLFSLFFESFVPIFVAPVALLGVFGAHVVAERPRLQLAPLYLWTIILLFYDFQAVSAGDGTLERSIVFRIGGLVLTLAVSAITCLLPVVKMKPVKGRFQTFGIASYHLKAPASSSNATSSGEDEEGDGPSDSDPLNFVARVVYPAQLDNKRKYKETNYFYHGSLTSDAFSRYGGYGGWIFRHLALAKSGCYENAPIAAESEQQKFPVIVMSHGRGGNADCSLHLVRSLVAEGFVVAMIEHQDASACVAKLPTGEVTPYFDPPKEWSEKRTERFRQRQCRYRSREQRFTLDELTRWTNNETPVSTSTPFSGSPNFFGRLDIEKVATMGHSFGGATSFHTAVEDPRIKACLYLDGWQVPLTDELRVSSPECPVLMVESEGFLVWQPNHASMAQMFRGLKRRDSVFVSIKGSYHMNFCDVGLWAPLILKKLGLVGPIDPRYCLNLIHKYNLAFLKKFVTKEGKQKKSSILNKDGKLPAEVVWHDIDHEE